MYAAFRPVVTRLQPKYEPSLEHRAISQEQHDKSMHDLTVKMGYETDE